ncbi:PTS system fructose-specific transporter subunits IIBC [Kluyvera cryocrescens]|uniref:PTS system fructose-specific transporter subunits IIBC n=1 Tax=Kluyvera cryocrescens TaxID=580 RepID=A0A485C0B1_KLUCR|nr:PTS system fructose-specific transporter subunits IIBC [Kluyvera cryocrescens]
MKTLLIIDAKLGQARAYMAKTLLGTAAQKAHLELIDNPNDADLAIVFGIYFTSRYRAGRKTGLFR